MQTKNKFIKSLFSSMFFLSSSFIFSMEKANLEAFTFTKLSRDIQKVIVNDFLEIKDLLNVKLVNKDFKGLVNEDNLKEKRRIANILGQELMNIIGHPDYGFDEIKESKAKEILNSEKVNLDFQDINGYAVLMLASRNRNIELLQLLIDRGVKINFQNAFGETTLINAAIHGSKEVVQLLIRNNANLDLKDNNSWTALMYMAVSGHEEMVQLLIDNGANLDLQDNNSKTALNLAEQFKKGEIIKILKDAEVIRKRKNEEGLSDLSKKIKLDQ